jgi:hypothetical protein
MKKVNTQRGIAPILVLLLLVLIAGGGAYAVKKNSDKKAEKAKMEESANMQASSTTAVSTSTPAVATSSRTFQINLNEQNKSGQSGKAVFTEVNGKVKVIVNITGKPSGVLQPSHIHLGSCAAIGAVKYPLSNIDKGAAQTMLDISMDQLLSQLPLALNVHKSATEIGVYTSCGDITASTVHLNASTSVEVKAGAMIR